MNTQTGRTLKSLTEVKKSGEVSALMRDKLIKQGCLRGPFALASPIYATGEGQLGSAGRNPLPYEKFPLRISPTIPADRNDRCFMRYDAQELLREGEGSSKSG